MRVNPDHTTQNYPGLQILLKRKTETLDPPEINRDQERNFKVEFFLWKLTKTD